MLVRRWQAPLVPTKEQIKMMFVAEDLEPYEEVYPVGAEVKEHRHPFDEVRVVAAGELFVNISGNQMLLRPGDRIEIPSNTKHLTRVNGSEECLCICAQRVFRIL
jgi:quercetin dioxygenase-like cupin family protein